MQYKTNNGRSKFRQQTRGVPLSVLFETWKQPEMERLSAALLETSGLQLTRSATAGNLRVCLTMQIKLQPLLPPAPRHVDSRCAWWGIKIEVGEEGSVSQGEINASRTHFILEGISDCTACREANSRKCTSVDKRFKKIFCRGTTRVRASAPGNGWSASKVQSKFWQESNFMGLKRHCVRLKQTMPLLFPGRAAGTRCLSSFQNNTLLWI